MGQLEDQQRRLEEMIAAEQIELAPHEDAMEFWDKVMRDPRQPMARRMNAAKERAQYRYPKLGVMATTTFNADDFASLLEKAIMRSGVVIEHRQNEGAKPAQPAPSPIPRFPSVPDRRFRR